MKTPKLSDKTKSWLHVKIIHPLTVEYISKQKTYKYNFPVNKTGDWGELPTNFFERN